MQEGKDSGRVKKQAEKKQINTGRQPGGGESAVNVCRNDYGDQLVKLMQVSKEARRKAGQVGMVGLEQQEGSEWEHKKTNCMKTNIHPKII